MYEIHLSNNQASLPIHKSFVRETVEATLSAEGVARAEIVVALVDDATIHNVNREHLQHDYPTDVISFLYDSIQVGPIPAETGVRRGSGRELDGELVVSTETAAREAARYGWDPQDELRLYIIHGLLHLCGYDDLTETEQILMRERERAILNKWGRLPVEIQRAKTPAANSQEP